MKISNIDNLCAEKEKKEKTKQKPTLLCPNEISVLLQQTEL